MSSYIPSPRYCLPGKQRGVATLFVGLVMLLMLTGIVLYTAVVSVEEKKTSANHLRTADAFARAEQGMEEGFEFFRSHTVLANDDSTDGWFPANGSGEHWTQCTTQTTLPCGNGSVNVFPGTGRYTGRGWVFKSLLKDAAGNPFDTADLQDKYGELKFDLFMVAECARPDCAAADCPEGGCRTCPDGSCTTPSSCSGEKCSYLSLVSGGNFSYLLMARGYSDDDEGQALVRSMVSASALVNDNTVGPVIVNGTITPTSTFTVVANPDAVKYQQDGAAITQHGSNIPLSIWTNQDASFSAGGTAQTCQLSDFLSGGTPYTAPAPDDDFLLCDDCRCPEDRLLSDGNEGIEGVDVVDVDSMAEGENPDMVTECPGDANFTVPYGGNGSGTDGDGSNVSEWPCDLFQFAFGVPGPYSDLYGTAPLYYQGIRDAAEREGHLISDCGDLGPGSRGLYWFEGGGDCAINANTVVGSLAHPVVLVVDEAKLKTNGGATFFGLIFSLDRDDGTAAATGGGDVQLNGDFLIYGTLIVDHDVNFSGGSYTARYSDKLLGYLAKETYSLAQLPGSWADFPPVP